MCYVCNKSVCLHFIGSEESFSLFKHAFEEFEKVTFCCKKADNGKSIDTCQRRPEAERNMKAMTVGVYILCGGFPPALKD